MTMDKGQLSLCVHLCFAVMIISSHGHPARPQQQSGVNGNDISTGLMPPIKKDVFMSRGWGASGMPFTMFYLNHFTKTQKAYAQNQQQQLQKLRQQEADAAQLQASEDEFEQPRTLPYGSRYSNPMANAQQSEISHGSGFKEAEEYSDGAVYLPSKPSSPRRQYNVPQLFVSYGWGPMG
ncbi:uncharacterized protein LOC135706588 [Ochlerotatus camptorhynchus]|uniref:uncharacterized protein LOC135706588 n=1 Tax=Ochlerotatus camptorhynchus TaxID=644619 RepID=UPI0031DD15A4